MASQAQHIEQDTGITGFSGPDGTLIRFDTSKTEARAALMASMDRLGPKGRELTQAEAGVRMGLQQRHSAQVGHPLYKAGRTRAARIMLRGAIKRLRRAREALQPVTIPVLEPVTVAVRQLDPAIWGTALAAAE